jgi:hypothetical protein
VIDLAARGQIVEQGGGQVVRTLGATRLVRPNASDRHYSNAQISNPPDHPCWSPPLTLIVRARFSHPIEQIHGTAGFGFWNQPLGPTIRGIRLPRVAWFIATSPPHDMPLALGVPGRGLKAGVMDARRLAFFALLPTAPIGILLMRVPAIYRRLWPVAQRAIGVQEAVLAEIDPTEFHTYRLIWERHRVCFGVDDRIILTSRAAPAAPLQFVAWIDNAYAVATPRGSFALGLLGDASERWLEITELTVTLTPTPAAPGSPVAP